MQAFRAHQCCPLVGTAKAHHTATCDPGRQPGVMVKSTGNGDRKPRGEPYRAVVASSLEDSALKSH